MITRDSFDAGEWAAILSAPMLAGGVVIMTEKSDAIGLTKEIIALIGGMKSFADEHAAENEFIAAVADYMADPANQEEAQEVPPWLDQRQEAWSANKPESVEEAIEQAMALVNDAIELIEVRGGSAADISSYKLMVYFVAEDVARAGKEGGFLGFGGIDVSVDEQSVLLQLRRELGV